MSRVGLLRLLLVAGFVAALEALCQARVIPPTVLLAPSGMAAALARMLAGGAYDGAIATTLGEVAAAAVAACGLGGALGTALHAAPRLRAALDPVFGSYYAVPTFLFYPLLIVFFGIGQAAIIGIAVIMSIVVMIVATLDGLDQVPGVLRRTARIHRLGRARTALHVTLPAAMPFLFTGFKLTVAYAFIGVLASEFIMSGSGLGYAIANAYNDFDNATMYGLMLFVVIVATAVNGALQAWDQRLQARRRP